MTCRSCGSNNRAEYGAEINIHLPKDQDKAAVLVFPKLVVCLDCGVAELTIPEAELRQLGKGAQHLLLLRNSSFISGEHRRRLERRSTADKLSALAHRFHSN
jgi:hypothetical protein